MRRALILILLSALSVFGQTFPPERFAVQVSTDLAAAAEVVTIQQPATGSRRVFLEVVNLYCEVATVFEFEMDGTAATATALTRNTITFGTPTATAWSSSDVGNGTTLFYVRCAAGEKPSLNMEGFLLQGDGTGTNFTVRTDSVTGLVDIYIRWREE